MQEFTAQIKNFTAGISATPTGRLNSGLTECYGLMPQGDKLVTSPRIANPLGTALGFPFPQIHAGGKNVLLETDGVSRLDNDFAVVANSKFESEAFNSWHVIDFGAFLIFASETEVLIMTPEQTITDQHSMPLFVTGCNFNGQLFVGGFHPDYTTTVVDPEDPEDPYDDSYYGGQFD